MQLALALADLAIQMWQVWEAPTEDLIGMFGSKPDTVIGLLEFLKVMPEEIGNPMLCLTHADREIVATRLGQNCVSVIPFLENCIEVYGHESSIVERTFACLDSWLRFGGQVTITFAHSPLLTACFEAVVAPDPILRDCACEAIVSALYLGRDSEHHPDLTPNLIGPSLALRPTFAAAAAENDFGLAQSVARVLVEVAEALVDPSLVTGSPTQEQMAAIEAIAEVAHYDDSDTVHLTFGFWYRFATEIYETSRRIQAAEDLDMFMDQFRSFFRDLYVGNPDSALVFSLDNAIPCDISLSPSHTHSSHVRCHRVQIWMLAPLGALRARNRGGPRQRRRALRFSRASRRLDC